MDEDHFARIEKLFTKLSVEFSNKVDGLSEDFAKKLDAQSEFFNAKLDAQSHDFQHWFGAQGDRFQHKLDLVVDGHRMLSEKLERIETRIDQVESSLGRRIDGIAADLAAHRADTEAHHGMYRVKEGH